ncbi:MAG: hypothetical protein J0I09_07335 [Sphingobacteriia bacterium]|nr:hypothetical protein [Sphingobacteriia bacterium]
MKPISVILIMGLISFVSCKKNTTQTTSVIGEWKWIIQYTNNPSYTLTPISTGINETLSFNSNSSYSIKQNGVIVSLGTFKNGITKRQDGKDIQTIFFTNNRVTDSASYFETYGNDTLYFSAGLIGISGSGARYYIKQ